LKWRAIRRSSADPRVHCALPGRAAELAGAQLARKLIEHLR
jgi:hypothetical protein